MKFRIRALDKHQTLHVLTINAVSKDMAASQVRADGLELLSLKSEGLNLRWRSPKTVGFDATLFSEELLALISAGLSLMEAIETLQSKSNARDSQRVLEQLGSRLKEGLRLSQAMEQQYRVFPPLLIGLIQAAEDTSNLSQSLSRFVQYDRQIKALGHRIANACIYPLILLTVGALVTIFLLGHVVPKFATVYQGAAHDLPLPSQWLLAWGQWVSDHQFLVWAVVASTATAIAVRLVPLVQKGNWWDLIRWAPGASARLTMLDLSRIYMTLGMLLENGIPILRAMKLTNSVVHDRWQKGWKHAQDMILQGLSLTQAFSDNGMSTPVAARLMTVGEKSGQMGTMLAKTAEFHDNEAARWIEKFSKIFEPVLMAVIGLIIGLIVILLYIPVFELAGSLQ